MADVEKVIEDVLVEPLENVLLHVGRGIAQSQIELDRNSLATQVLIDNNKDLSEAGVKASWYHFPEVNLELKMALSLHGTVSQKQGKVQSVRYKVYSAPQNALYQNTFQFEASGQSTLKARIVSIPPPIEVKGT